MLRCACGYTCGVPSALERHLGKFAGDPAAAGLHGRVPDEAPAAPQPPLTGRPAAAASRGGTLGPPTPPLGPRRAGTWPATPPTPPERSPVHLAARLPPLVECERGASRPTSSTARASGRQVGAPLAPNTAAGAKLRLLIVRHAQSANKEKTRGQQAAADPELSELGYQQAEALGQRFQSEFGGLKRACLMVVSSPMRRCLLTILPAVQKLGLGSDSCLTHGACFEYACAGLEHRGRPAEDIVSEFPEFAAVGFRGGRSGCWDYRGESPKENEAECKARAVRVQEWLVNEAPKMMQHVGGSSGTPTLVLCMHQTFADILCHQLVDGSTDKWKYGEVKHRLNNTAITEVLLDPHGQSTLGVTNCDRHIFLMKVRQRKAERATSVL